MARKIEVLVLNHGAYNRVAADELTIDTLRETMAVNFEGSVAVWKAIQPHLSQDARMVVVGSQLGTRGLHKVQTIPPPKRHWQCGLDRLLSK